MTSAICKENAESLNSESGGITFQSGTETVESVPLPEPGFVQYGSSGGPYTADQLQAYCDERERAALARVAELESLIQMIAQRAASFPLFPMGYHLPEVFKAAGMDQPVRSHPDATHDDLTARVAELEHKLAEAENDARRYRWLKRQSRMDPYMGGNHRWHSIYLRSDVRGPTLDVAIDAAIAAGGGDGLST